MLLLPCSLNYPLSVHPCTTGYAHVCVRVYVRACVCMCICTHSSTIPCIYNQSGPAFTLINIPLLTLLILSIL